MSHQRKLKRSNKPKQVFIVRPHKQEKFTCQKTSLFIMKAQLSGIAMSKHIPSKAPEYARNKAIYSFINDPALRHCTHIFFIDDDSPPFTDDAIHRLYKHNKPFVAGVTPIFRTKEDIIDFNNPGKLKDVIDLHWSAIIKNEAGKLENIGIGELPKKPFKAVRTGGTGLLVRRDVLEKIEPPYQITTDNESHTDIKLSEDIYFSEKVRDAGFDLWVDPTVQCSHFHTTDILEIFMIAMQAKKAGYEEAKADFKVVI